MSDVQQKLWDSADDDTVESLRQQLAELCAENKRLRESLEGIVQAQCQIMTEGMCDAVPVAHRLALELECLLLSCTDTAATAKWWDSAHEALDQWREFCREDTEEVGYGDTALLEKIYLAMEAKKP